MVNVLLTWPLPPLVACFAVTYVVVWCALAVLWFLISAPCNLELASYHEAVALTIELMMEIGYGVPDPTFGDCAEVFPVLAASSLLALFMDSIVLSVLCQRFSRFCQREATVVFSARSVLRVDPGTDEVFWMFRICELRRQQLLEPKVVVHCVRHVPHPLQSGCVEVQVSPVLLDEPNEGVGDGKLFLALPATVVHKVGALSPLAPLDDSTDGSKRENGRGSSWPDAVLRHLQSVPYLELVAIFTGIDASSGGLVEARQSYTLGDISWKRSFAPCVSVDGSVHTVDYVAFHEIVDEPPPDGPSSMDVSEFCPSKQPSADENGALH